jgi:hypothetical protein
MLRGCGAFGSRGTHPFLFFSHRAADVLAWAIVIWKHFSAVLLSTYYRTALRNYLLGLGSMRRRHQSRRLVAVNWPFILLNEDWVTLRIVRTTEVVTFIVFNLPKRAVVVLFWRNRFLFYQFFLISGIWIWLFWIPDVYSVPTLAVIWVIIIALSRLVSVTSSALGSSYRSKLFLLLNVYILLSLSSLANTLV